MSSGTELCNIQWLKGDEASSYNHFDKKFSMVDLFSGCGGMTLGAFEALKHEKFSPDIKLAVENNEIVAQCYERNFGTYLKKMSTASIENWVTSFPGDRFSEQDTQIAEQIEKVDLLLAGPPCQGHSRLNNYTRSKDPRNKLYLKVVRFAEIILPEIIIIENVTNIVRDNFKVVDKSCESLSDLGYSVLNLTLNTADYGIAQNRKRHIQVAAKCNISLDLSEYEAKFNLSHIIDDIVDEYKYRNDDIFYYPSVTKHKERIDYLFDNDLYDLPNGLRPDCHKTKKHTYPSCYGRLRWNKPSTTITRGFGTMGQGRFLHPKRRRTISPHEAARIQGFPDFFNFLGVKTRKNLHLMIANAVPPRIISIILNEAIKQLQIKREIS